MARSNIRDRKILFLSQENDCLSFIAEAIAKKLLPPKTQVFSAGLKEGKIDPKAVRVLQEIGIDVSAQEPKRLDAIPTQDIDLVVRLGESGKDQAAVTPVPSAGLGKSPIRADSRRQILTHSATPETKSTT